MDDPRYEEAKKIVEDSLHRPSISFLQRQMRIGYNYARRLMDGMLYEGFICDASDGFGYEKTDK